MKKPLFAGLVSILLLLIIVSGSHSQEGRGHYIGSCPELKLWKNNALFLQAKDLYNRSNQPGLNNEWQGIVNKVDELDARMTEFVRTCSELKARAAATNAKLENVNRRGAAWNDRWSGRPMNSGAMAEKNQLEAEANEIISEQQARETEWREIKSQHAALDAKYQQLEQEIPRFISSLQAGGAPKNAGQPLESAKSSSPNVITTPTQQHLQEANNLKEQGNQYSKNKQWQQAVDAYKAALQKHPGNAELRHKYALALKNLAAEQRKAIEAPTVSGPSPQGIPPLPRLKEAHNLGVQGNQYYENKQWQQAADAYRAALQKHPGYYEIRDNYALALDHLAAEQRKGIETASKKGQGSTSPGKQLKSVEYHSRKAKGLSGEAASEEARIGFDTAGTNRGSLKVDTGGTVVDLSGVGKRPEWPASVKGDKVMRSLQQQQDGYNATYQQKEKELSQVRKEMDTADPVKKSELAVKGAKIKEDMAKTEYKAALKEKEIRKRAKQLIDTREEGSQ